MNVSTHSVCTQPPNMTLPSGGSKRAKVDEGSAAVADVVVSWALTWGKKQDADKESRPTAAILANLE